MIFENKKYVLFDLDGTLTDSSPGIIRSVKYALKAFGIEETDDKKLEQFIGPPLYDSFVNFYGFSEQDAREGIKKYREYYKDKGIFENSVYEGIPEFLKALYERGYTLILATSKPEVFAKRILEHFDLDKYFAYCCGSDLAGNLVAKPDIIRYAMKTAGITNPKEAVMIGDRHYDVTGGQECGMEVIGVLFGFGTEEEMLKYGADVIAPTTADLMALLG